MMEEDKTRCSKCKRKYPYEETAFLCCREKNGCRAKATPKSIITHVCGETVKNGKWYFCRSYVIYVVTGYREMKGRNLY